MSLNLIHIGVPKIQLQNKEHFSVSNKATYQNKVKSEEREKKKKKDLIATVVEKMSVWKKVISSAESQPWKRFERMENRKQIPVSWIDIEPSKGKQFQSKENKEFGARTWLNNITEF